MMRCLSRGEQRQRASYKAAVAVGLECHLRNLASAVIGGDPKAVTEFQQFVQYAPPKMRERVATYIDSIKGKP